MKKLKQIVAQIKTAPFENPEELTNLLWQLICYPPKMPLRLQQQQLLDEAENFKLVVSDEYFAKKQLVFNGFKWGTGKHKILITHGWGSKAADFYDLISALKNIGDWEIIAFDAPGNGSSEGELSNLLLFVLSVKAMITKFGMPDIYIGHSLGAMANIIAIKELQLKPTHVISISPLIKLKENFEATMNGVEVSMIAQDKFFKSFEQKFNLPASYYDLNSWYSSVTDLKHLLIFDKFDQVSTYNYLEPFLIRYPSIISQNYEGAGHERIIKSTDVIDRIVNAVNTNFQFGL